MKNINININKRDKIEGALYGFVIGDALGAATECFTKEEVENEYGEIIYLARKDFQIKHMGHRIELGEIETAVSAIEEITLCCCLYDTKRQKIVLFCDADLSKEYIHEKISKLVPEYMFPNRIVYMETMPINANGKIDRVKLKELL